MPSEQEIVKQILDLLDKHTNNQDTRLEIIANVIMTEGLNRIPPELLPDKVTPENVVEIILNLKKEFGETIELAMVHQGLVMLMWLENNEENQEKE